MLIISTLHPTLPPSILQDFIRQVCKPAYTNVFRDRDGVVGVVEFETGDDMDRTIRCVVGSGVGWAGRCAAGGLCSGHSGEGRGTSSKAANDGGTGTLFFVTTAPKAELSKPGNGHKGLRACWHNASVPCHLLTPLPLFTASGSRRKLDDTEFRNPFDRAYVRLVEDRDGGRGGKRVGRRGRGSIVSTG